MNEKAVTDIECLDVCGSLPKPDKNFSSLEKLNMNLKTTEKNLDLSNEANNVAFE